MGIIGVVITLVLLALIAVVSMYYGGDSVTESGAKASATQVINNAQQVAGAVTFYSNDNGGVFPPNMAALVSGKYLKTIPSVPAGAEPFKLATAAESAFADVNTLYVAGINKPVCEKVLKSANVSGADKDKLLDYAQKASAKTNGVNYPFFCFNNGTDNADQASYTFVFK